MLSMKNISSSSQHLRKHVTRVNTAALLHKGLFVHFFPLSTQKKYAFVKSDIKQVQMEQNIKLIWIDWILKKIIICTAHRSSSLSLVWDWYLRSYLTQVLWRRTASSANLHQSAPPEYCTDAGTGQRCCQMKFPEQTVQSVAMQWQADRWNRCNDCE